MIDYISLIPSRDIREYLYEIHYQPGTQEAAFLVWQNRQLSLERKIVAWEEIIRTMPDCEFERGRNLYFPSFHQFLRDHIAMIHEQIRRFKEKEGSTYSFVSTIMCNGVLEVESGGSDLDSFEDIIEWAKLDISCIKAEGDMCITIERFYTDDYPDICEGYPVKMTLNRDLEVMAVEGITVLEKEEDSGIEHGFDCMWLDIPTPFRRGDLLKGRNGNPVVLNYMLSWDTEAMIRNGFSGDAVEAKRADERVAGLSEHGDTTDMGYSYLGLDGRSGIFMDNDDGILELEYYREPLAGAAKALHPLSEYLKGKVRIDYFLNGFQYNLMQGRCDDLVAPIMGKDAEYYKEARVAFGLEDTQ